jgi:hypothetical protein
MLARYCNLLRTRSFRYLSDGKLFRLESDAALRPSTSGRVFLAVPKLFVQP